MRRMFALFLMSVVAEVTAQTSHLTFDDALSLGFERNPAVVATEYAEQDALELEF